jgi:hypothetical protein
MDGFRFPPWIDRTRPFAGALLAIVPIYVIFLAYYWGSPQTTDVGYSPVQPLPYSHAMHAGQLGMDCRWEKREILTQHFAHPGKAASKTIDRFSQGCLGGLQTRGA